MRELVINRLEALWSPEQIAGRLLADGVSAVRVCAETIYRFIYGKEDYALALYRHLPEGRRKRRRRSSRKPRDGLIPFNCGIDQRPDFIADRSQFGHWEGDLLIFERALGNANVTSLVERKSRYTVMIKNGSRHSRPLIDKIVDAFAPLPAFARQSFTFDRGTEFRGFKACDPNSPWQKGAVAAFSPDGPECMPDVRLPLEAVQEMPHVRRSPYRRRREAAEPMLSSCLSNKITRGTDRHRSAAFLSLILYLSYLGADRKR